MKRIVYLVDRFPSRAQPSATDDVLGLAERGFEIEVRVLRQQWRESEDLPADLPIRSSSLGLRGALRPSRHPGARFRAATRGAWLARRLDPSNDHVHAQSPDEVASVGMFAARKSGASLSFAGHSLDELMREKLEQARFVVVGSEFECDRIAHRYGQQHRAKLHLCRSGVPPRPARQDFAPRTVVSAGALTRQNGHDILIRAVGILRESGFDASLELIGEGPDRPGLQGIVAALRLDDRVTFARELPHEETLARIARAEVFALACRETRTGEADFLPVGLMDAMSLGVPCVSSNVFGIPELIEDGVSGLLAPTADPEEVAGLLSEVLGDPGAQDTLGSAGRVVVQERYDRDRNLDALACIFRNLV